MSVDTLIELQAGGAYKVAGFRALVFGVFEVAMISSLVD